MEDKLFIPASRWTPVEQEPPKPGQLILTEGTITVFEDNKEIHKQKFETPLMEKYDPAIGYCGNTTVDNGDGYVSVSKVTHWAPCPILEEN